MCRNWELTGKCPLPSTPARDFDTESGGAASPENVTPAKEDAGAPGEEYDDNPELRFLLARYGAAPEDDPVPSPYPLTAFAGLTSTMMPMMPMPMALPHSAFTYVPTQYVPMLGAAPLTVFNPVPLFSLGMPPMPMGAVPQRNPFLLYGV
jgi:hypothetical protein